MLNSCKHCSQKTNTNIISHVYNGINKLRLIYTAFISLCLYQHQQTTVKLLNSCLCRNQQTNLNIHSSCVRRHQQINVPVSRLNPYINPSIKTKKGMFIEYSLKNTILHYVYYQILETNFLCCFH